MGLTVSDGVMRHYVIAFPFINSSYSRVWLIIFSNTTQKLERDSS